MVGKNDERRLEPKTLSNNPIANEKRANVFRKKSLSCDIILPITGTCSYQLEAIEASYQPLITS